MFSKDCEKTDTVKRPWDVHPKHLHPKQRIFLSIDAIDSTKIKSSLIEKRNKTSGIWAENFSYFLHKVEDVYLEKFTSLNNGKPSPGVFLWKYIGDEVVLTTELTCREQPLLHLFAVRDAVHELNKKFSERGAISCKACVWTAGFPVGNIEVAFPEYQERKRKVRDYLGASVDFGFRLAKYSKRERIAVGHSMLALLETFRVGEETLKLYSGGPVELKGIDERYPLFWMATPAFIDDGKEYPHEVENPDALKKFLG